MDMHIIRSPIVNTAVYGKCLQPTGAGGTGECGAQGAGKIRVVRVKADRLAKKLGVSRGSFDWHFADVSAFRAAILKRWREIMLENIIEEIERVPDDRLEALIRRAFAAGSRLESAVRAWATADPLARVAVEAVDVERIGYLRKLLIETGVDPSVAERGAHHELVLSRRRALRERTQ